MARVDAASARAAAALLSLRNPAGHWTGVLSSSALSTATATTALAVLAKNGGRFHDETARGLVWLAARQNSDGGWGDTTSSPSNLSTTTLGWAAFGAAGADKAFAAAVGRAEDWLARHTGGTRQDLHTRPDALARAIVERYGKDRTFSAPILTLCALSGRLGAGPEAWRRVIQLPFELAALPRSWFAALQLPVVSYALPALIAIGQVRHARLPSGNPLARWARNWTRSRTLKTLAEIQPQGGGFLEATPLTSFVVMSLAGAGITDHPVISQGTDFLLRSQRPDGSWAIDTNLATWVTTLAVNALGQLPDNAPAIRDWLRAQQYAAVHPYTLAAPGGWAWTDLPGGVPDADDTAGALLALRKLDPSTSASSPGPRAGLEWLLDLQNRDGGIPTFCRGWGALPFDQSSTDITAHALRAWLAWTPGAPAPLAIRMRRALGRALDFLARSQRPDGSWTPLWFGNSYAPNDENPTYGTARVLPALVEAAQCPLPGADPRLMAAAAARFLTAAQQTDGGWSGSDRGPASVEETALATEGLASAVGRGALDNGGGQQAWESALRGAEWLAQRVESGQWTRPAPIGLYFARLWYWEELYPVVFTTGALRAVQEAARRR